MAKVRALLSAFGPFLGRPQNQSQQVLEHALRRMPEPWRAQLLPVNLAQLRPLVVGTVQRADLEVWLALGESGLTGPPVLETVARNLYDLGRDVESAGGMELRGVLEAGGPERIELVPQPTDLAAALIEGGHSLALSEDAGSHCCNALLYLAARAAAAPGHRAPWIFFLHLPRQPEQSAEQTRLVHAALSWLSTARGL